MTDPQHVDKTELLQRLRRQRARFAEALRRVPFADFLCPATIGRWSVRDLLAHLAAHEQRALAEIAAAQRGERLAIDYSCSAEFNAGAVYAWSTLSRETALAAWDDSFRQVIAAVEGLSQADFMPSSALEQVLGDTIDGALANNTYAHYAEHLPRLEAYIGRLEKGMTPST
jgi:uncharacterized protein (TIGR03083 family)